MPTIKKKIIKRTVHLSTKSVEDAVLKKIKKVSVNARRRARRNEADIVIIQNGKIILIETNSVNKNIKRIIGKIKRSKLPEKFKSKIRIK